MNTFIEIRFPELFNISFKLFKQIFRSIIDEKVKIMSKERKIITQSKNIKEKEVHVNSIKLNSIKLMHLKKIVTRVIFLHFMYIVICSIVSVMIENIKIKIIFDNRTKVNCIFKRLIDVAQLFMRQNINIIMINVTDERARFFDVYETIFVNIDNITISISVFVVKRSDNELFFKKILSTCCSYKFY